MTKQHNYIELQGSEAEGHFLNADDSRLVHDGSVSTGHGNYDDCSCYDYCECSSCKRCDCCGESTDYCDCESCYVCNLCEYTVDECGCDKHQEGCTNPSGSHRDGESIPCCEDHVCTSCYDAFTDDYYTTSCDIADNVEYRCDHDCSCECECETGMDGELVSEPMKPEQLREWQQSQGNYPDYVNRTCGYHVHTSTVNNRYMCIIMNRQFHDYLKTKATQWGHRLHIKNEEFWKRLDGENTFCHDRYKAYEQIVATEHYHDDRYTFVNYCFSLHKTMEIRVAPAFKQAQIATRWLEFCESIVNKYIHEHRDELTSYVQGKEFTFN